MMRLPERIKAPGWARKRPSAGRPRHLRFAGGDWPGNAEIVVVFGNGPEAKEMIFSRPAPDPDVEPGAAISSCPTPKRVRPDLGFDRERAAWLHAKPDLLRASRGKFVVFVGEEMAGPYETSREAAREGWIRFGPGPIYVKQVLEFDPIEQVGVAESSCRS
jgi:hypothetical protein